MPDHDCTIKRSEVAKFRVNEQDDKKHCTGEQCKTGVSISGEKNSQFGHLVRRNLYHFYKYCNRGLQKGQAYKNDSK